MANSRALEASSIPHFFKSFSSSSRGESEDSKWLSSTPMKGENGVVRMSKSSSGRDVNSVDGVDKYALPSKNHGRKGT
jgi:hypothetical protein